ncbi:hypothetical protein COB72_05635 [bacterium]|nr:MAG: hypothetical protein COB72_05635 [bacterium]
MTTKHKSLPSLPEGIEPIPQNELDSLNADSGIQNEAYSAYLTDYGSTTPDIGCDLYQRLVNPDGSQGEMLISYVGLCEVEQLITLLQVVRTEMQGSVS